MFANGKLLKWNWVSVDPEDSRVIDNNELLEKRLTQQKEFVKVRLGQGSDSYAEGQEGSEGGFTPGMGSVPGMEGVAPDGAGSFSSDDDFAPGEFRSGLDYTQLEGILEDPDDPGTLIKAASLTPMYDGPSPQELIDEANQKIDEMYSQAQQEIESMKAQAVEEGRALGMEQGYNEGLENARAEYEEKARSLEAEYHRMIKELEPDFVKHLSGIYEHLINVQFSDYQTLVVHLLESCLLKAEGSSSYIIHVSVEDYPFVSMQKKSLMDIIGSRNATFDIIEDNTLKKNECMIETDGGIYDCSLDAQLKALRRELMTLAYQP